MKRLLFEVGLVVAVLVLGLEAVHYRNAVIACNIDDKRAWKTVVELRSQLESMDAGPPAEKPDAGAAAGKPGNRR